MTTVKYIDDPLHGVVTVIEGDHGVVMTNAKPDTRGQWVKHRNTYRYIPSGLNRAARRKAVRGR